MSRSLPSRRLILTLYFFLHLAGCAPSLYKTHLTHEQRSVICGYSDLSENEECLRESDQQIEWCKEALGQERDCWNTLLGDLSKEIKHYAISDTDYIAYLHDPLKLRPLIHRIQSDRKARPLPSSTQNP